MFCSWMPDNVKTEKLEGLDSHISLLGNTTSIVEPLHRFERQFAAMYKRKAFVHWFTGEGMDSQEFEECYGNF